jgi:anaerobic ribonucleoside-triphosphate reductase activating protein
MLKYHSSYIGFREIPDEISLCINISNCPNNCEKCHSPWLLKDEGTPLTYVELINLIKNNKGITCVCFMGGDREPWEINRLAQRVTELDLKSAWYSGKQELSVSINPKFFHYIKLGPYIEEKGPLDNPNTNQKLYKTEYIGDKSTGLSKLEMIDITNKFWNDNRN